MAKSSIDCLVWILFNLLVVCLVLLVIGDKMFELVCDYVWDMIRSCFRMEKGGRQY